MKSTSLFAVLTASALLLVSCSEKSSKTTSNSSNPIGTTTGATAGGATTGGTNPGQPSAYNPIPSDNNWGDLYKDGPIPGDSCSSPTSSSDGSLYGIRKGTITVAGGQMYAPDLPWSRGNFTNNTSHFLQTVAKAKPFFDTDAKLRVRFKVLPQPSVSGQGEWCFGRVTGQSAPYFGYRNLRFNVGLRAIRADGTLDSNIIMSQDVTAGLNGCTTPVNFDGLNQNAPYGVAVVVQDVQSDQNCTYRPCTAYRKVRSADCWRVEMQVSADDTVDFQ